MDATTTLIAAVIVRKADELLPNWVAPVARVYYRQAFHQTGIFDALRPARGLDFHPAVRSRSTAVSFSARKPCLPCCGQNGFRRYHPSTSTFRPSPPGPCRSSPRRFR